MTSNENAILLKKIVQHFDYPSSNEVIAHSKRLVLFCEYRIEADSRLSASDKNQYLQFICFLNKYCDDEKKTVAPVTRRALYSQLQDYAFYSTVALLPVLPNESDNVLYALFAQLCCARGYDDYSAFLQFYKAFLKFDQADTSICSYLNDTGVTTEFVCESTLTELKAELLILADRSGNTALAHAARYFQAPRKQSIDLGAMRKNSIIDVANKHTATSIKTDACDIALVQTSDEAGQEVSRYLEITANLNRTESQRKRVFQRQQTGIRNALRKNELALPLSLSKATAAEVRLVLEYISKSFVYADYQDVSPGEASVLAHLFLKLLGLSNVSSIHVENLAAKVPVTKPVCESSTVVLRYEFDTNRRHVFAQLLLPAELIKTARPTAADYLYEENRQTLTLNLPTPIGTILNIVLRNSRNSTRRHNVDLVTVLKLHETEYRQVINRALIETGLKQRGIRRLALENAFHQYAREKVPETLLNFLKCNATVQSHYINVSNETFETVVENGWRAFLESVGLSTNQEDTHEKSESGLSSYTIDERVGSVRYLKSEALELLYEQVIKAISHHLSAKAVINTLNNIVLYTYIRIATKVGLRPVNKPFPVREWFDPEKGLLSVSDKRVHHQNERRLIVLTNNLKQLLIKTSVLCEKLSLHLAISEPSALVMFLDRDSDRKLRWQHLSKSAVDAQISTLVSDDISCQAFRHCAATDFLEAALDDFHQQSLDTFMNHSRAGAAQLSNYSLFDIQHFTEMQRHTLDRENAAMVANDKKVLELIDNVFESQL